MMCGKPVQPSFIDVKDYLDSCLEHFGELPSLTNGTKITRHFMCFLVFLLVLQLIYDQLKDGY